MSEIKPGCYILQPITPISAPNIQLLIQLLQGDFPLPSPFCLLTHPTHRRSGRPPNATNSLPTHTLPNPPRRRLHKLQLGHPRWSTQDRFKEGILDDR